MLIDNFGHKVYEENNFDFHEVAVDDYYQNKLKNMDTKPWWKSKTIWIAVAQGALGIIVAFKTSNPALVDVGWIAIAKSIIDVFLRMYTATAIA